jgi:hypothetical protein
VLTPNILASKSGEGPLPYCKIGAESEGNNRPGSLVSDVNVQEVYVFLASIIQMGCSKSVTLEDGWSTLEQF